MHRTGQENVDSGEDLPHQVFKRTLKWHWWKQCSFGTKRQVIKWHWVEPWRDTLTVRAGPPSALLAELWLYPAPTLFLFDSGRNPAVADGGLWPNSGQWEVQASPSRAPGKPQPFYPFWTGLGLKVTAESVAVAQSGIGVFLWELSLCLRVLSAFSVAMITSCLWPQRAMATSLRSWEIRDFIRICGYFLIWVFYFVFALA